jgi:hypothetical protein
MRFLTLLLAAGLLIGSLRAEPPRPLSPLNDGNDLLRLVHLAIRAYEGEEFKSEKERTDAAYAMGYLKGVKEASWVLDYSNDQVPYILPTNLQAVHLAKVIERYLTVHPEKRAQTPYAVIALAFTEAFRNPKWKPLPSVAE